MEEASNPQKRPGRSRPRRIGIALASLFAVWITVLGTYQVLGAALWPDSLPTEYACRDGASALLTSLETARERAASQVLSERDALSAFRHDLKPVWSQSQSIFEKCKHEGDKQAVVALRSLELLRYAEERAIRLSAVDLTKLRKSTPRLVQALKSTTTKK